VEGLRVISEEEAQIERWREGRSDSALMRGLFMAGVAYLEAVGGNGGSIQLDG